jgi:hypothetical protein
MTVVAAIVRVHDGHGALRWPETVAPAAASARSGQAPKLVASGSEPVKLDETSGGWFYLTTFLGLLCLDGRAGLVDPHLGGQARG